MTEQHHWGRLQTWLDAIVHLELRAAQLEEQAPDSTQLGRLRRVEAGCYRAAAYELRVACGATSVARRDKGEPH